MDKAAFGALGVWFAIAFGLHRIGLVVMVPRVEWNAANLTRSQWWEFAIRFLMGGTITMAAGIIGREYGPGVGGLFLAFPAILPATATLVAQRGDEKKAARSMHGEKRSLNAAALDANGAFVGSAGLLGFALVAGLLLVRFRAPLALLIATLVWAAAMTAWIARKHPAAAEVFGPRGEGYLKAPKAALHPNIRL